MDERVEIQLKSTLIVNNLGWILIEFDLLFITLYVTTAWFDRLKFEHNLVVILCVLVAFALGGLFIIYRRYDSGTLHFIPEGIIIQAKIGYIPITYKEVKYYKRHSLPDPETDKLEFSIETNDSRKFRIRAYADIYNGLVRIFPDKESF